MTRAVALARIIYTRHAAGCCLHVVLDDGNLDDSSVEASLAFARENGDRDCIELAELLVPMNRRRRAAVVRNHYGRLPSYFCNRCGDLAAWMCSMCKRALCRVHTSSDCPHGAGDQPPIEGPMYTTDVR